MGRFLIVALFVLALAAIAAGAGSGAVGAVAAQDDGRPVSGPIVFTPARGTVLEVAGRGPFRGTLEVRRASGKLTLINDLDLESYVQGLDEVPGTWPMEALKAQAVAARTYALWERDNEAWLRFGYDICATTTCQVYDGAALESGDRGKRWIDAVRATRGEVLLFEGKPALARYHASSGGLTVANADVFPKTGHVPYLRAVHDPPDKVSPLHAWEVRFTLEAMTAILREGVELAGALESIEVDTAKRDVTVRTGGGSLGMTASRLRAVVSQQAPRLFADRYPAPRHDGRTMPTTLPSSRFEIVRDGTDFVFKGKGYGHGVGMSQWGAKGRAERGDDYRTILRAYYPGLTPSKYEEAQTMRVGLTRSATSVTVSGSGAFEVSASDDQLARSTVGRWSLTPGSGRSVLVRPPDGFNLPLVLSGIEAPRRISVRGGVLLEPLQVTFVLPKAARVDAVLRLGSQKVASAGDVFEAGDARLRVEIADPGRLPSSGEYALALTAFDGEARASRLVQVVIVRPGGGPSRFLVVAAVMLAVLGAGLAWRRRRIPPEREPSPAVLTRSGGE